MITSVWHKILHKRNVLYEILFIALATILHFFKMYANEEIQEDIVSVTEQGIIHLLLILAVIYIGMFLKYHNKRNVMNMAGRVLDKVLCLLIIMKILRNEIDKGTVIMLLAFLIGDWLLTEMSVKKKNEQDTFKSRALYEGRKEQLEQLIARIKTNSDSETICISAPWGSGKTFFIHKVCERLKEYPIVTIQAMDMEDQEKLYKYVFSSIGELLEARDYYTGMSSEWQKYVSSFGKVLFGTNALIHQMLSTTMGNTSDYRTQKDGLSDIFDKAFGKQKLLIIVDDLERCDVEKARVYLQFIKEIATFPRTLVIFLADYEKLISNGILTQEASNKFISEVITLQEVNCDEIQKELEKKCHVTMDSEIEYFRGCFDRERRKISMQTIMLRDYSSKRDEKEKELNKQREDLEQAYFFFQKSITNPRYYLAIAYRIEERKRLVNQYLGDEKAYLDRMMAMHQIFIISWIQVVMSNIYTKISEIGIIQFVNSNLIIPQSTEMKTLAILTECFWQRDTKNYYDGFVTEQRYTFANNILQCTSLMKKDAVQYQSEDEKCIIAAEQAEPLQGEYAGYKRICGILGYYSDADVNTRNRLVRATLSQMKELFPRDEAVYEIISLMKEGRQIHTYSPITLYSDCYKILRELDYWEVKGLTSYSDKLLTPKYYYNQNVVQWTSLRQYLNALTGLTDVTGPQLEWNNEEQIQDSIQTLKSEFEEAEVLLKEHQAMKYPDVKKSVHVCKIILVQLQALYEVNKQIAKICEAQCISDDNIMEKVTEELNILRTLLEKDEHVKGKTTMEWDIPKIKEYIDYVANMEKKSVVKELVDKLNEIVSIAVELDESREYTALRSELLKCCR